MAKWLGAPLGGGVTTATRAKDTDRQETCAVLDNAFADGELSGEEHRERVSRATNAVTLGDLKLLVSDLQGSTPTRLRAAKSKAAPAVRARGIAIAALVVSVLFGMGLGWGLYGNTSSPLDFTSDPGAKPDGVAAVVLTPPKQLHSLGGLTGLLEQARKKFGDTIGYRLLVYPTYASFYRPDPADDRRVLDYDYRGGWDDPTASPKTDAKSVAADLGKFDVKAAVGVLRGAPETLGIKPSEVKSTYLIIEPAKDPTAPGTLTLSVYVSGEYGSGSIDFAGDGTPKRVNYPSS
ncbi:hypothetical protein AWC05_21090 [Mycobacterium florentinum]|uniref:DUF1707 domain-containing protein n=1 Tax=Mycobacterium florentinum TaxID=292462 RepID=A0A1X1U5B2_MYCFL|nr:DUF1707 domain-containing protein [Mycobacterium florentinum]MCV7410367.1 DUF1707 domain-containing protein [Mycobacterium florentinum]ORV52044.1 hypothetical protein AWC05_21090 [Mycobacterium florentinum]BBX79684.1 hypothetical protein MFLOJ_34710 [Mycobacterium florentinum]